MNRTFTRAIYIGVLIALVFSAVAPVFLFLATPTAFAADQTGWDSSLPYYWVPSDPTPEVVAALKSGKNSFFVAPGTCHPTLEEWGFGNGRRVYKEDLCPGQIFQVWGMTTDSKWVVGSRDGIGERRFFPTYRLTTFIYTMPTGTKPNDCTGLPADITMNATPGVNRQIRLAKGADKLDVQVAAGGASLLRDVAFSSGQRVCIRRLQAGEWAVVRYTLPNTANGDPVWAYVRITLPNGSVQEGLVRTMDLVLPGQPAATSTTAATTSSSTGAAVQTNVSSASATTTGTQTTTTKAYKVKSGDTLGKIAKENGTSVSAIQNANGMGTSTLIKVNQTLVIPATP